MIRVKKIWVIAMLTLMSLFTLVSCVKENGCGGTDPLLSRTILVYLAGDNNLGKLAEIPQALLQGWSYTGNRCLIYYDAPGAAPRLLSLRGGCSQNTQPYLETIAEYPEENSASVAVFGRVVRDVVEMYPADSYGLIFTSHGSGWLPEGELNGLGRNRSLGLDVNTGTGTSVGKEMELSDFAAVIPNHQFDFIIFESCLMAGVEVAYELRNKTAYILAPAAELIDPGFLPIYSSAFSYLINTNFSVQQGLEYFGEAYFKYVDQQSGLRRSAVLSVIETAKMEELATVTAAIMQKEGGEGTDPSTIQHFDRPGYYGNSLSHFRYFDFGQYIESVASAQNYQTINRLLDEIVKWKKSTDWFMKEQGGFAVQRHCGLTTYIQQDVFPGLNERWRTGAWGTAVLKEQTQDGI